MTEGQADLPALQLGRHATPGTRQQLAGGDERRQHLE